MCVKVNSPSIASNLSLAQAREAARKHDGNEVIVKDKSDSYSVHELKPQDFGAINQKKASGFEPKAVEFSIQKQPDKNVTVINKNAKFTDNARSELLTIKENAVKLGHKVNDKVDEIRDKFIDNTEKLFDNLSNNKGKSNRYVKGGSQVDLSLGKVQADCSGFVSQMFQKAGLNMERMTAADIGEYVRGGKGFLKEISKASDIKPTDVITFDKASNSKAWYTGHAMIAISTPTPIYAPKDNTKIIGYNVDIIDSTSVGHGDDTRAKGKTGAGFGTVSFSVDKSGNIDNFYWSKDMSGKEQEHNVTVGTIK